MASRRILGVIIAGAAAAAVVAVLAGAVVGIVRNGDDHGRRPDQVIAGSGSSTTGSVTGAEWSADGSRLYVVDDSGIAVYTGSPLAASDPIASERADQVGTWSPDHHLVVLSSSEPGARVWDVTSATELPPIDSPFDAEPAWSPDGSQLAFAAGGGTVVIRDAVSGTELHRYVAFDLGIDLLGISWPRPDRLVVVSFNSIQAIGVASGEQLWTHAAAAAGGLLVASSDGTHVVVASGLDHDHDVYSVADGTVLGQIELDSRRLLAADWSADGRWLIGTGDDERPRLWDVSAAVTREEFATIAPYATGGAWAPDSHRFALADAFDRRVVVIDATGAVDTEELSVADDITLRATAWSPSGDRLVAVGADGTVHVWSVATPPT